MCKVAGVVKVNDANRHDVWLFMMVLGEYMSQHNNDGLGYAAFDKKGNIFGEKWLVNDSAFTDFSKFKGLTADKVEKIYNFFGDKVTRDEAQAIILHTRMATCAKNIHNTHPFVNDIDKPEIAIIHNGIITNDNEFTKKYSTCDSEVLVHLYDDHKVVTDIKKLNEMTEKLIGWYTVLALSKTLEGTMVMDAFTDNGRLSSFYIPELKTRIYSTNPGDIIRAAKFFSFQALDHRQMIPNHGMRINVLTGEVISTVKFETKKWEQVNNYEGMNVVDLSGTGAMSDDHFVDNWFRREE